MRPLLTLICLTMVGCSGIGEPSALAPAPNLAKENQERIEVISVQQFDDGSASQASKRTILVLRDKKTKQEYLCVIGGGITEMRRNSNPKASMQEEE